MSSHQKIIWNGGNPHVGLRLETSMRALYGSHRRCFEPFVPPEKLTERQQQILDGEHVNPRKREITALLKKLRHHNRMKEAEKVYERYKHFYCEICEDDLTTEEAAEILSELTPEELK